MFQWKGCSDRNHPRINYLSLLKVDACHDKFNTNNLLNSVFLNTDYFAHCFHKALRFTVCMGRHAVCIKNKPVRVCRNKPIGISCSLCVGISWSLCVGISWCLCVDWNKLMPVYWNKPTWRLRLNALGSHRSQCYTHCPREDVNPDFKVDIASIFT